MVFLFMDGSAAHNSGINLLHLLESSAAEQNTQIINPIFFRDYTVNDASSAHSLHLSSMLPPSFPFHIGTTSKVL